MKFLANSRGEFQLYPPLGSLYIQYKRHLKVVPVSQWNKTVRLRCQSEQQCCSGERGRGRHGAKRTTTDTAPAAAAEPAARPAGPATMEGINHLIDLDDLPREQAFPGPRGRLLRVRAYPLRHHVEHHAVEELSLQPIRKQACECKHAARASVTTVGRSEVGGQTSRGK